MILILILYSFFFKQKTAYEMRISDWSSDVCSSDLQPAVVNISTKQEVTLGVRLDPFAGTREPITQEQQGGGSGFLISADGYIVTNNHVIAGGPRGEQTVDQVTVPLTNPKEYTAKLVGRDAPSDLAMPQIDLPRPEKSR